MPEPLEIILTNQVINGATQTTLDLGALISTMQTSGMTNQAIKNTLMNDLTSGGRIFGSFKNFLKNTVKNGVEYNGNQAQKNVYQDAQVEQFRWVAVGDKSVCPDCDRRNGQIEPIRFWEAVGEPKSGFSVCQTNCRCTLVPATYKGENLDKPLLRSERKKPKVTDFDQGGKHTSVQDSIQWLEKNIADRVNFKQIKDVAIANQITKSLKTQFTKYNLKKLDEIVVSRRGNKLASANGGSLTINSKHFTKKGLKEAYYNSTVEFRTQWVDYLESLEKQLKEQNAIIQDKTASQNAIFSAKRLKRLIEQQIKTTKNTINKYNKFSRYNVFNKNNVGQSVIDHEIGHIIHDQFSGAINQNFYLKNFKYNDPNIKKWNERWENIFQTVKRDGSVANISGYASENKWELFAESFTMYVGGEKSKLPKIILEYLDSYLEELSK